MESTADLAPLPPHLVSKPRRIPKNLAWLLLAPRRRFSAPRTCLIHGHVFSRLVCAPAAPCTQHLQRGRRLMERPVRGAESTATCCQSTVGEGQRDRDELLFN